MITILIVLLVIASQQGRLAAYASPIASANDELRAICDGKSVEPLTVEQVTRLGAQLGEGADCSEPARTTLVDLDQLIRTGGQDICSEANTELMKGYFAKYVASYDPLPSSVEAFLISYFVQVSLRCKTNMIEFLSGEASEILTAEDFESLFKWTREGGDVDRLLDAADRTNNILPSDLAALLDHSGFEELRVGEAIQPEVHHIKEVCAKRFKPVYEPIVWPVITLSRTGFDFPEYAVRHEKQTKRLDEFNRIVLLCQAMDLIVDEPAGPAHGATVEQIHFEPKTKVSIGEVRVLSDKEIRALLTSARHRRDGIERFRNNLYNNVMLNVCQRIDPELDEQNMWARHCILSHTWSGELSSEPSSEQQDSKTGPEGHSTQDGKRPKSTPEPFEPPPTSIFISITAAVGILLVNSE